MFHRGLKTLVWELADPASRFSGFTVGNRESLNRTDIRDHVNNFHNRYYSSNLMSLVIVSNDTLDRFR